jgi:hypothetical protein
VIELQIKREETGKRREKTCRQVNEENKCMREHYTAFVQKLH